MGNENIISLTGKQKKAAKDIFRRLPLMDKIPFGDDDFLHSTSAARLFAQDELFATIVGKIRQVSRSEIPALCIHGFPIGGLSTSYRRDPYGKPTGQTNEYIGFMSNPAFWAEHSSQLFSAIIGLLDRKPSMPFSTPLTPFFQDGLKELNWPYKDKEHGIRTIGGMANLDGGQALHDPMGGLHTHGLTMLLGLHSAGLDEEGNLNNVTRTYNFGSGSEVALEAPVMRGTVYLIADNGPHMRPRTFERAGNFQRLVINMVFDDDRLPVISEDRINNFLESNQIDKSR